MSGLEILGAIAASITLIEVIQSSLKFLSETRKIPRHTIEQRDMHFYLAVQSIKFEAWCAALRLTDIIRLKEAAPSAWKESAEFLEVQKRLAADMRFGNAGIAELTLETLGGLKEKFEAAWTILKGHRSVSVNDFLHNEGVMIKKKKRWYQRSMYLSKNGIQDPEPEVQHNRNVFAAIKWVGNDKKAVSTLLDQIRALNDSLLALLEPDKQERAQRQSLMRILDDPNTGVRNSPDSVDNNDLAALVRLKNLHGADFDSSSLQSTNVKPYRLRTYSLADFQGALVKVEDTRWIGQLDNEEVLVEWKYYSKEKQALWRTARLANIVGLLNYNGLHERFLAPRCKGLIDDWQSSRTGIVFRTSPAEPHTTAVVYRHLQDFIRSASNVPAVGQRFLMAKTLAAAMSSLHSVHWLHESFRSDNVVFFQDVERDTSPRGSADYNVLPPSDTMDTHPNAPSPTPLPRFYIVGWNLSRPDNSSEFSESLSLSSANHRSKRENMMLYTHPEIHSFIPSTTSRPRYRTEFNIYSLGLVLLEIGLWRTLDGLRRKCATEEEFRGNLRRKYCDKLLSKMGVIYWRATLRCITNDFDLQQNAPEAMTDFSLKSAFEQQVVSELSKCVA